MGEAQSKLDGEQLPAASGAGATGNETLPDNTKETKKISGSKTKRKLKRKHKPHLPRIRSDRKRSLKSGDLPKDHSDRVTYLKEEEEDILTLQMRNSNLMRREKVLALSKAEDARPWGFDSDSEMRKSTANRQLSPRFAAGSKSQGMPLPGNEHTTAKPRFRRSNSDQQLIQNAKPPASSLRSTQSGQVEVPGSAGYLAQKPPPEPSGGAYLNAMPPPGVCEDLSFGDTDTSDSVDWDALDEEDESEEYFGSDNETPKAKISTGPKDYTWVLEFLTTIDKTAMNEIGQRMSKRMTGFMNNLTFVVQDYQEERKALGDDSDEYTEDDCETNTINSQEIIPDEPYREGCDWNNHFQQIISQLKEFGEIQEHRVRCYRELTNLALDFVHCAKTYGMLIISEAETPVKYKTIPPTKIGGFAGGDKYIVNNILFKFAVDSHNMFDSEEAAHKVAGHDLKGLISYFNLGIAGLHFPLMALVDYLGYRLIAISVLPICDETLVYGSADAGIHAHNSNTTLARKMKLAGELLNLKIHTIGSKPTEQTEVYSAGDLEGHEVDDRFYLLDFSRAFPPCTYDRSKRNSYLFRLLRPEFVKNYKIPLCSDAYSGFVSIAAKEHIKQIENATRHLLHTEVPKLAATLDRLSEKHRKKLNLKEVLHENGINLRYLGLLRHSVKNLEIKAKILVEMLARVIKHKIREMMREQMKKWKLPLEHNCRQTAIDYLNLVFGSSEESDEHFDKVLAVRICDNFVGALSPEETQYPLKKMLSETDLCSLFSLVQEMTALRFPRSALKEFSTDPSIYNFKSPFHNTELTEIGVRIRHLNIVALAQGYVLKVGARSHSSVSVENTTRLCKLAMVKFSQALEDNPGDKRALNELADTSSILGNYQEAREYYLRAIAADPMDSNTLFRYAVFLEDKMKLNDDAEEYYLRTLEVNPTHDHCLQRYGHFLECQGNPDAAEDFFIRASEIRRSRMMALGTSDVPNLVTEDFIF